MNAPVTPPARTTITTVKKLLLGFGTLTALLVLSGVAIMERVRSIEARVVETALVARDRSAATRQLEINVLGYVLGLRGHFQGADAELLQGAMKDAAAVERHLSKYKELAVSERQRAIAARFTTLWQELKSFGQALLEAETRQLKAEDSRRLYELRSRIEKFLDEEMQVDAAQAYDDRRDATLRDVQSIVAFAAILLIAGTLIAVLTSTAVGWGIVKAESSLRASRELLRVTLESIGDAVITTDTQGRVTFMNAVAESLTGSTLNEAAGKPLETVFHIVDVSTRAPVDNPAARALRESVVVGLANHSVLIAKDGAELSIDDSAAPIRDERGQIAGCVLILRDVSRQRQSLRALERSEARKSAMFDSALDCIVSIDQEGKIIEFNAAAERTFGHRREDLLGEELAAVLIPPAYRERHRIGLARYLVTGEGPVLNQRLELSALRADGTEFPIELTVTRIPVDGPPLFTAYLRDITERKAAADALQASEQRLRETVNELRRYAADLSESDRHKNEFLAMLAHELRNPLAPIRNALHVMRLTSGNAPVVASVEMMERQVGQMVHLMDDLLDVSRISRGKIELRRERAELASVIHHAVEACSPAMERAKQELTLALPPQPIYVDGDPARLVQVVGNLLDNARKFTDEGGRIQLTLEQVGGEAVIRVRDTGIGIAADQLPRIFEMFTQLDHSVERSVSGLGIGLTLVKTLVEMHAGTVEAQSAGAGKGSAFVVRLPLAAEKIVQTIAQTHPLPPVIAGEPSTPPLRRVLIVDDNRDSAESLAMLLQALGHETEVAHDGLEAVEAAAGFMPEVILLDIGLPKLNGYETCRRIREAPWGKGMLLVATSGWGRDEDRLQSRDAGFDAHLIKPLDLAALTRLLAGGEGRERPHASVT